MEGALAATDYEMVMAAARKSLAVVPLRVCRVLTLCIVDFTAIQSAGMNMKNLALVRLPFLGTAISGADPKRLSLVTVLPFSDKDELSTLSFCLPSDDTYHLCTRE